MKFNILLVALWATTLHATADQTPPAKEASQKGHRNTRQTNADQMVQNILQWLQGVYTQNARKIRQGTLREYLPPTNTQKPRPFEPQGYPPAGITPQPPFPPYERPTPGYPSPNNEITPPFTGFPSSQPPFTGFPFMNGGFPWNSSGFPGFSGR